MIILIMNKLKITKVTIGHNRYSTFGGKILKNVQPLYAEINKDIISIAHNGNITNAII